MKKIKILALLTILCCPTIKGFSVNTDTLYISPNPFDSITVIHFDIVQNDTILLNIYDRWGNSVKTFFQNTVLPSGFYSINFIADTLPNDIYIVVLKINSTKTLMKNVIKTTLGINENETVKSIQHIYPNPTTGMLRIPFDGLKTIIVTDFNGRIFKNIALKTKTISLSDLESGEYIMTILSEKRQIISTEKIVLTK
jgi:hypothetical protein